VSTVCALGVDQPEKYLGFAQFTTELNEATDIEKDKIPINDTKLRPDQRLYGEGKNIFLFLLYP
jgi:hypothetical protein